MDLGKWNPAADDYYGARNLGEEEKKSGKKSVYHCEILSFATSNENGPIYMHKCLS